jgi:hypothetical protein
MLFRRRGVLSGVEKWYVTAGEFQGIGGSGVALCDDDVAMTGSRCSLVACCVG